MQVGVLSVFSSMRWSFVALDFETRVKIAKMLYVRSSTSVPYASQFTNTLGTSNNIWVCILPIWNMPVSGYDVRVHTCFEISFFSLNCNVFFSCILELNRGFADNCYTSFTVRS